MFTLYQNATTFIIEKKNKETEYIEIKRCNGILKEKDIQKKVKADLKGCEKVVEFFGIVGIVNFRNSYLIIAKSKESPINFRLEGKYYNIHSLDQFLVPISPDTFHNGNSIKFLPELNIKQSKELLSDERALELTLLNLMTHALGEGYYASHDYPMINLFSNKKSPSRQPLVANAFLKENLVTVAGTTIADSFCSTMIFGSVSKIEVAGIIVLLLQRRFTPYFGPRYRKRGLSKKNKGFTANSIEVEMILGTEASTNSIVLHRGSIPIYWTEKIEDIKKMAHVVKLGNNAEPFEDTTAHYDRLLKVHGLDKQTEIFTLSLLRYEKENLFGKPSKDYELAEKYKDIIHHISSNSDLNMHFENINVLYAFDRELETSKMKELLLESETMKKIFSKKIFYTVHKKSEDSTKREKTSDKQDMLLRVNCIDSTDRTNLAVGYFLYNSILEICKAQSLFPDIHKECRFWKEFNELFQKKILESGDLLALQYVGSLAFFGESFCFDDCLCDIEKCANSKITKKFIKKSQEFKNIFKRRSISDRFNDNFKQYGYSLYFGFFDYQKRECKDITKLCPYEECDDFVISSN